MGIYSKGYSFGDMDYHHVFLAIWGGWRGDFHFLKQGWFSVLIVLVAPVFLMAPYFWNGITSYLGSPALDGWSYMAYGQYLLDYPRGAEGGLPPLAQYAAHLSGTRYIASALLGFFALLFGPSADTQTASGLFFAWSLFVFSSSCMFVGGIMGLRKNLLPIYVCGCVFSGWLLNLLSMNNYDNALAISFLPAFAGISHIVNPNYKRWALILAGLLTALLYCYPEMSPFVLGGTGLFFIQRILRDGKPFKPWLILIVLTCVLLGIGIIPLHDLISFFIQQAKSGLGSGVRPGGNAFPGLLEQSTLLICFWGFPPAVSSFSSIINVSWFFLCSLLSFVLSIVALLGIYDLFRRKEWGFAFTIIVLLAGTLYMIFGQKYPYGAYKLILLNWWAIAFLVVTGMNKLLELPLFKKTYRVLITGSAATMCALFFCLNGITLIHKDMSLPYKSILPFKKVTEIEQITGVKPVIVNVNDHISNQWAVYFLRNVPISLTMYRSYMGQSHVIPLMKRSQKVDVAKVDYVLTDKKESFAEMELLWQGGPYYLRKYDDRGSAEVSEIRNGNGLEKRNDKSFFWIGKGDTEVDVLSTRKGIAIIQGAFLLGPSLPDRPSRELLILTDNGYQSKITISANGFQALRVPVIAGENRIILRPLDKPSVSVTGPNDNRPLLIGVEELNVTLMAGTRPEEVPQ